MAKIRLEDDGKDGFIIDIEGKPLDVIELIMEAMYKEDTVKLIMLSAVSSYLIDRPKDLKHFNNAIVKATEDIKNQTTDRKNIN